LATVDAAHARGDVVTMKEAVTPGTIIVRTQERRLYYVTGAGQAISYPVGVGRVGKQWSGTSYISGKSRTRLGRRRPRCGVTSPICRK
jgi:lipoprotein-anchoring transpeptidase ErfK/SrfK